MKFMLITLLPILSLSLFSQTPDEIIEKVTKSGAAPAEFSRTLRYEWITGLLEVNSFEEFYSFLLDHSLPGGLNINGSPFDPGEPSHINTFKEIFKSIKTLTGGSFIPLLFKDEFPEYYSEEEIDTAWASCREGSVFCLFDNKRIRFGLTINLSDEVAYETENYYIIEKPHVYITGVYYMK